MVLLLAKKELKKWEVKVSGKNRDNNKEAKTSVYITKDIDIPKKDNVKTNIALNTNFDVVVESERRADWANIILDSEIGSETKNKFEL